MNKGGIFAGKQSFQIDKLGEDGAHVKLGIMGGTFDPIHYGHLFCAEQAKEACNLDAVLFIPAGDPAFKQDRKIASAEDRFSMCKLATFDNPYFEVSDIEITRSGITYTSDTLHELRKVYPDNVEFDFIIGSDSLDLLHLWHDAADLAKLAKFICVERPGYKVETEVLDGLSDMGFTFEFVDAPLLDISSSDVRKRIEDGRSIRYLVPLPVIDYLESRGLIEAMS